MVIDPADIVAAALPVQWAIKQLTSALQTRGRAVVRAELLEKVPSAERYVVVAGAGSTLHGRVAARPGKDEESLELLPSSVGGKNVLLASGTDVRGVMYAVLELADRVKYADDVLLVLDVQKAIVERPQNAVRSIVRPFVSEVEDKPWFYDREYWQEYLAMLATNRFNRFHLALGLGYDTLQYVTDAYFLFSYPFLTSVPGYNVRAVGLADEERDRNLEMLKFISEQASAHGIDFVLGLWTHGYQWKDSPKANYTIEGITGDNHASYCRDALTTVLKSCPAIRGVTLRTHYESGVPERSYDFWRTIFSGVPKAGREIEIDLHTKGLDEKLIEAASVTGMPIRLSPKFWAEHMGLTYHQAAIRDLEMPKPDDKNDTFSALSFGSRLFTRYGYADFLREDRKYKVMHRVFPGTHKFLLWGDPVTAAAYSRAFGFCGSDGAELFEPLAFKGRRGSGVAGGRCAYKDASLNPRRDWEKYLYTYRVWGRLLYNPAADPNVWRRLLRKDFGPNVEAMETTLGTATRILPLITTSHLPSAAHDTYSPEFYVNQSMPDPAAKSPYGDTPMPKVFGNVSPLDPRMFSGIDEFASELLKGERSGKYSPVEVAQWLDDLAYAASTQLQKLQRGTSTTELRRAAIDVAMQIGIGRFFAAKFRSGVLYAIHEKTGDREALERSLTAYRGARDVWAAFAQGASKVYVADITFGPLPHQRGQWADRVAAMDADIALLAKKLDSTPVGGTQSAEVKAAIAEALGKPQRIKVSCNHVPAQSFVAGKQLDIGLEVADAASMEMFYRHVNQGERYQTVAMTRAANGFTATIPAAYTDLPYPLEYYFEVRQSPKEATLYPGLGQDRLGQPYFVVRQARRG